MRHFIIWLFVVLPVLGFAQDYQTVRSDFVHFFLDENGDDHGMQIDSAFVENGDSVLLNYQTVRASEYGLMEFKAFVPSWLGAKIIIQPNGDNRFFNSEGDTITVKTQAQLNESWNLYNLDSISYIEARVTSTGQENVLDTQVDVKTISLQRVDYSNSPLNHPLNGKELKLSDNKGIIQGLDFYHFPEDTFAVEIFGSENPSIGVHRLTWREVYDFQVGDEFHYSGEYDQGYTYPSGNPPVWKKRIEMVTDVEDSADVRTISFMVYNWEQTLELFPNYEYVTETNQETANRVYENIDERLFESLPNEAKEMLSIQHYTDDTIIVVEPVSFGLHDSGLPQVGFEHDFYYMSSGAYDYDTTTGNWVLLPTVSGNESTFSLFGAGIGRTYWNHFLNNSSSTYFDKEEHLVYYKKGSVEWGEPHSMSLITDMNSTAEITPTIYPNPVQSGQPIQLSIDQNSTAKLFSIDGKQIPVELVNGTMKTDNLVPGIYLIRIETESGISTQKLIVTD